MNWLARRAFLIGGVLRESHNDRKPSLTKLSNSLVSKLCEECFATRLMTELQIVSTDSVLVRHFCVWINAG